MSRWFQDLYGNKPVKALIESKLKKYQEKIEVPYRASELMNAGV